MQGHSMPYVLGDTADTLETPAAKILAYTLHDEFFHAELRGGPRSRKLSQVLICCLTTKLDRQNMQDVWV